MRIKKITEIKPRVVYAIGTSTGTFIADGLAHHNCYACNMLYNGQPSAFAVRLEREAPGIVAELERLRRTVKPWSEKEMLEKAEYYKQLVEAL